MAVFPDTIFTPIYDVLTIAEVGIVMFVAAAVVNSSFDRSCNI